jgi:hypothetical protein
MHWKANIYLQLTVLLPWLYFVDCSCSLFGQLGRSQIHDLLENTDRASRLSVLQFCNGLTVLQLMVLRVNTDKVEDATRFWLNNFILLYLVEMHKDLAMIFYCKPSEYFKISH